jgi:hypothetical protein
LPVGYGVRPGRLGVPQDHQVPLCDRHAMSVPA